MLRIEFKSVIKVIISFSGKSETFSLLTVLVYCIYMLLIDSKNIMHHQNLGLHHRKSLNMADEKTTLVQIHHCAKSRDNLVSNRILKHIMMLLAVNTQIITYISTEIGTTVSLFGR